MNTLRNAALVASSADMRRRGKDLVACFTDDRPLGEEKLRFEVEVTSAARGATLGVWRFVEVVDGEPVSASFAACAAAAYGGGQHLAPPEGERFPDYTGVLSFIYTLPAPMTD